MALYLRELQTSPSVQFCSCGGALVVRTEGSFTSPAQRDQPPRPGAGPAACVNQVHCPVASSQDADALPLPVIIVLTSYVDVKYMTACAAPRSKAPDESAGPRDLAIVWTYHPSYIRLHVACGT